VGIFNKNKLNLKLERFSFTAGETIKGSFIIDLEKSQKIIISG